MLKRPAMQPPDAGDNRPQSAVTWDRVSVLRCIEMHLDVTAVPHVSANHHLGRVVSAVAEQLRAGTDQVSEPRQLPFWLLAVFVDGAVTPEEEARVLEAILVDNSVLAEVVSAFKAKHEIRAGLTIREQLATHLKSLPWTPPNETLDAPDSAIGLHEDVHDSTVQLAIDTTIDSAVVTSTGSAIDASAEVVDEAIEPIIASKELDSAPPETVSILDTAKTGDGTQVHQEVDNEPPRRSNLELLTHLYENARTEVDIPSLHLEPVEDRSASVWWKVGPLLGVLVLIIMAAVTYAQLFPDDRMVRAVSRMWNGSTEPSEKERIDQIIKENERKNSLSRP